MSTSAVSVISLGGTIAMTSQGAGASPALDAEDLLAAIPELEASGLEIRAHSFRNLPGASLGFGDLAALARHIDAEVIEGADGIVVTQGTDTIEETAFFLHLTVKAAVPIAVTGAMRHASMSGADGPANVLAAIRVAASGEHDLGCVVVMSDEIHDARRVRKVHSMSTAAFASPDTGPVGYVVEGQPRLLTLPGPRSAVPLTAEVTAVRVPIVPIALGTDAEGLRPFTEGADGLVVAGLGAGHVPEVLAEPLGDLASRIPVVLASRTGAGPVLTSTYGFPGSERDLQARGLINAGFLDPYKARILLHLLIASGRSTPDIRATFSP